MGEIQYDWIDEEAWDETVSLCGNMFGKLTGEVRIRLIRVLQNPTQSTWQDAHCIIINGSGFSTMWQGWLALDPSAPRSKGEDEPWPRIPTRDELVDIIRNTGVREDG